MKLEIKHLATYLPYRLKCQYNGILNGSEIGVWEKRSRQYDPFESFDLERPAEILGDKVGTLRKITVWNSHSIVHIGNRWSKVFYEKSLHFKPILRPLSQLKTEEGIAALYSLCETTAEQEFVECLDDRNLSDSVDILKYCPVSLFAYLCENHFDVFNLIDQNLAIEKP